MMVLHLMDFDNRGGVLAPVMDHVKRYVFSDPYVIRRSYLNLLKISRFMTHVGSRILDVAYKYLS